MRDRTRAGVTLVLTAALTLSLLIAAPVAAVAAVKVAIIVGPTGSQTAGYRASANGIYDVATAAGAEAVKVYSPNATWANVKAAVEGANIIVYLGHGNGFPSPYSNTENTDRVNGWGLNRTTTNGDGDNWSSTMVYCGEKALLGTLSSSDGAAQRQYCGANNGTQGINPAPGFVMIYQSACYAPGAGETADATEFKARERVRNYSYPTFALGGSAYFANDFDAGALVDAIIRNPTKTYGDIAVDAPGYDDSAQRRFDHADVDGAQIWIQKTYAMGRKDYWYAYAGNPNASFADPNAPPPPPLSNLDVNRLAGSDRFATAAAVSNASFSPGVPVAYVATGFNFPDALAGSAAAGFKGGPTLLVDGSGIPAATAAELTRLQPQEIVVLGGTAVISEATRKALAGYATSGKARRLAGDNRYETAAAISADTFSPGVSVAFVATGANFPDALAGTPPAGNQGGPILLVNQGQLPAATAAELTRLKPGKIVILGGTAAVSKDVADALRNYTTGAVKRLAGSDRYATAVAVSSASYGSANVVYVATGADFPDALAGGAVAGIAGAPLLLVAGTSVPSVVQDELLRLNPSTIVILGSTGVVSSAVVNQIRALFP